jgi:3',5'-cyclic AMP phosphodiesterase CpdA
MPKYVWLVAACAAIAALSPDGAAQQAAPSPLQVALLVVAIRPIQPPATPLPPEPASAQVTRFSFIAYGDTRSPVDGQAIQPDHAAVVDKMIATIKARAATPFPVRFVIQTGDAVANGTNGTAWNVSYSPIIERITGDGGVPYYLVAGNHDVALNPANPASRSTGLHNMLSALSRLIPPEGSPRRLSGYPTYSFGYGNLFVLCLDSNISGDLVQLAWATDQLEHLDRSRYAHVIAVFHHPPFSSGPHGGVAPGPEVTTEDNVERQTAAIRSLYAPLFRRHHVRMTLAGHDHFYDHWIERYTDGGVTYRRDDVVTAGGGAPIYTYRGEPDVRVYLSKGAVENVRLEHPMRPGMTAAENPHHFIVVQVDGARLSLQVIGARSDTYAPYPNHVSRVELID